MKISSACDCKVIFPHRCTYCRAQRVQRKLCNVLLFANAPYEKWPSPWSSDSLSDRAVDCLSAERMFKKQNKVFIRVSPACVCVHVSRYIRLDARPSLMANAVMIRKAKQGKRHRIGWERENQRKLNTRKYYSSSLVSIVSIFTAVWFFFLSMEATESKITFLRLESWSSRPCFVGSPLS